MQVVYKQNIFDKLTEEIDKNAKRIDFIELTSDEHMELQDIIRMRANIKLSYKRWISVEEFNGIKIIIKEN